MNGWLLVEIEKRVDGEDLLRVVVELQLIPENCRLQEVSDVSTSALDLVKNNFLAFLLLNSANRLKNLKSLNILSVRIPTLYDSNPFSLKPKSEQSY